MSFPGTRTRVLVLLAATLAASVAGADAQQSSSTVRASVAVAAPPILLENSRNLQFGSVSAGEEMSVTAIGPHAEGTISAAIRFGNIRKQEDQTLGFTLPVSLVHAGGGSLPVSWSGVQYGSVCIWASTPGTCNVLSLAFSPAAHTATPIQISIPNNMPGNNFTGDVYIGGRLTVPASGIVPGVYTGTITVIMAPVL